MGFWLKKGVFWYFLGGVLQHIVTAYSVHVGVSRCDRRFFYSCFLKNTCGDGIMLGCLGRFLACGVNKRDLNFN